MMKRSVATFRGFFRVDIFFLSGVKQILDPPRLAKLTCPNSILGEDLFRSVTLSVQLAFD
jgi:hypothetical protein